MFVKALREIGRPKYVRFLINKDDMKLLMQPHDRKEFISFRVPSSVYGINYSQRRSFVIRSRAFCGLMASWQNWDKSLSYRVSGKIYPKQNVVVFDLKQAEAIMSPNNS